MPSVLNWRGAYRRIFNMKLPAKIATLSACLFLSVSSIASAQYVVKSGDTLSKIAKANGMTLTDIIKLNPHFDNPNIIHVGDPVTIRTKNVAQDIVDYARSLDDKTTYAYGGQENFKPPLFTDCSGWTQHIYGQFGITLPRTSGEQSKVGTPVAFKNMKIGDLMFFSTRDDKVITHVGIFMGNDYWISNLSTKQDVEILSTFGSWTQKHFLWAQRVI